MKIRNVMKKFAVLVLGVVFLSACSSAASAYVALDPKLADWITIGATAIVGFLLMKLATIPQLAWLVNYLGQYRAAVAAWLSGVIVQFVQAGLLDKIPAMWDNVVIIVMQLIVAVIVTLYSFRLLGDRNVKGFRA